MIFAAHSGLYHPVIFFMQTIIFMIPTKQLSIMECKPTVLKVGQLFLLGVAI